MELYGEKSQEAADFKSQFIPTSRPNSLSAAVQSLKNKLYLPYQDAVNKFIGNLENPEGTTVLFNHVNQEGKLYKQPSLIKLALELDRFIEEKVTNDQQWNNILNTENPNTENPIDTFKPKIVDYLCTDKNLIERNLLLTNRNAADDLAEKAINRFRAKELAKGAS